VQRFSSQTLISLVVDCALLALCLLSAPSVLERAGTPFTVRQIDQRLVVDKITDASAAGSLQPGDVMLQWNADTIAAAEIFEFLGDLSSIGDHVTITYERNGTVRATGIVLTPYYESARFLIVSLCVGFITWLVALFILFNRTMNRAGYLLHWALIAFAVAVMITWGRTDSQSLLPLFTRTLFFVSYSAIPALFVLFTTTYPRNKFASFELKSAIVFPVAVIFAAGQSYYQLSALYGHALSDFAAFQDWFDAFNVFLLLSITGCIVSLIHSYRSVRQTDDKRRIEWLIWGFCISPVPFLLLIKLPQLLHISSGVIPEEYTTIFFLLIPFSFAVSLIRYNVMDIEIVINRSIVSVALTILIGTIYGLAVMLAATSLGTEVQFKEYALVGIIILLAGLILNPVRRRIQHLVDAALFPAKTNFRKASADIVNAFHRCYTADDVYAVLQEHTLKGIPLSDIALYSHSSGRLRLETSNKTGHPKFVALSGQDIESISKSDSIRSIALHNGDVPSGLAAIGCSICVPLFDESSALLGIAAGTPSVTVQHLNEEEYDLFLSFCDKAGETLGRRLLQEKIILKNKENERLAELSNLKSYFVSSVSHELRTPLTSIRMFAEMARANGLSKKKQDDYLHIVEGESERLSRLIDNVLDFSAIERKKKEYKREMTDPGSVVRRSVQAVRYLFQKEHAVVNVFIPKRLPPLFIDPDAFEEVCINLLSNALKYSPKKKHVAIRLKRVRQSVRLEVSDTGIGIPRAEIGKIFGDFYRVGDPQTRQAGGTGLGLALVKHIVEFHNGTIEVHSTVGKGSTFTITLPVETGT